MFDEKEDFLRSATVEATTGKNHMMWEYLQENHWKIEELTEALYLWEKPLSGVYFITILDGTVIYIGKTKNVMQRIGQHLEAGKIPMLGTLYFLPCSVDQMDAVESRYIEVLNPRDNVLKRKDCVQLVKLEG